MVNIAKCCMPIKGDDIVGYITKGQGISVHKASCNNIPQNKDRIVNVSWNMQATNYYYTNIYVIVKSGVDMLVNIITQIGKNDSLVKSCNTKEVDNNTIYEINVRIKDKDDLERVKKEVRKLSNVLDVVDYI